MHRRLKKEMIWGEEMVRKQRHKGGGREGLQGDEFRDTRPSAFAFSTEPEAGTKMSCAMSACTAQMPAIMSATLHELSVYKHEMSESSRGEIWSPTHKSPSVHEMQHAHA